MKTFSDYFILLFVFAFVPMVGMMALRTIACAVQEKRRQKSKLFVRTEAENEELAAVRDSLLPERKREK